MNLLNRLQVRFDVHGAAWSADLSYERPRLLMSPCRPALPGAEMFWGNDRMISKAVSGSLRERQILLGLGFLNRGQTVEINYGRRSLGRRYRRYGMQILELVLSILARLLRDLGALNLVLNLGELVRFRCEASAPQDQARALQEESSIKSAVIRGRTGAGLTQE